MNYRILLVEDNRDTRSLFAGQLKPCGEHRYAEAVVSQAQARQLIALLEVQALANPLIDADEPGPIPAGMDVRREDITLSVTVADEISELRIGQAALEMPCERDSAPEFSDRENEVLQFIVKGCSYKEIAGFLEISVNTVREYIRRIYRKLAVRSRGEAVFEAQALGLVTHSLAS